MAWWSVSSTSTYTNDLSSNPADLFIFYNVQSYESNEKDAIDGPLNKKTTRLGRQWVRLSWQSA